MWLCTSIALFTSADSRDLDLALGIKWTFHGTIKWIWAKTVFSRWYPEMMYANHLYLYELNVKENLLESNAFS